MDRGEAAGKDELVDELLAKIRRDVQEQAVLEKAREIFEAAIRLVDQEAGALKEIREKPRGKKRGKYRTSRLVGTCSKCRRQFDKRGLSTHERTCRGVPIITESAQYPAGTRPVF